MAVKSAGDTELGLDAHNSALHIFEGTGCLSADVSSRAHNPHNVALRALRARACAVRGGAEKVRKRPSSRAQSSGEASSVQWADPGSWASDAHNGLLGGKNITNHFGVQAIWATGDRDYNCAARSAHRPAARIPDGRRIVSRSRFLLNLGKRGI